MSEKRGIKQTIRFPHRHAQPGAGRAAWPSLLWKSRTFIIILLLSFAKLWMIHGLVIYPLVSAGCDDALMTTWALNLVGGKWTGPFSCYIFTKEVGFSVYLAVINRLRLPYIMATNLLYIVGSLILLYAISHVVKQKWILCILYAATLFHPIMTAIHTGQRVYRNGFAAALTLWFFGSLLNFYFEIAEKSFVRSCVWAVLSAGSLGYLWETKSDTVWLLPFTLAVLLSTAFMVLKNRKTVTPLPRLALLAFPFLGIILASHLVDIVNAKVYGEARVAYYGPAMSTLTHVDTEGVTENISLPGKTFQELCSISPTLATAQEEIEAEMEIYDQYDTHPGDGNVEDGWIGWALIEGIAEAGYYEDCQTANEFYRKVYEELSAAVNAGKIKLTEQSALDSYHLSTQTERKELVYTIGKIWSYVASHQDMYSDTCALGEESLVGSRGFEAITREKSYYKPMDTDYYLAGWLAFPGYDLNDLEVYVEDEAGNQLEQIEFYKSKDVQELYSQVKGTEKCRLKLGWDYEGAEENPQFYIAAYEGTDQAVRVGIGDEGFREADKDTYIGSVDGFFNNSKMQKNHKSAERAVKRCNTIYDIYHAAGNILAWAGLAAYAAFTLLAVWEWLQKRRDASDIKYHTGNAWLVVTGIMLSLLVLFAGVAVTHLENCPSISYMYLSASYPLFNLAAMLSVVKCAELTCRQVQRARGSANHGGGSDGF